MKAFNPYFSVSAFSRFNLHLIFKDSILVSGRYKLPDSSTIYKQMLSKKSAVNTKALFPHFKEKYNNQLNLILMNKFIFSSIFSLIFFLSKAQTSCGGVERWSVKVLTDAAAGTVNFTPSVTTITNLVNIVTPPPSSTMPRYAGIEDKTYSVTCNITIKKAESDNDYHLVLSDGINTMIGEIPDPACSAAASSAHVNQYIAARNFVNANIASGNVYNVNLPPVVVYGVAFIDPPHGQTGAAPNNLEIHPILNIHFASTSGTNELYEILKVNVFPNPAKDKLLIEINSKIDEIQNCEFRVFNLQGSLVKTFTLPPSRNNLNYTISVNDLSSGLYIYRITKDQSPFYEGKFIKE